MSGKDNEDRLRLVYTPRAYVFIKDKNNKIHDVSRYVVSGEINRLVDQVSTAEITFRNPHSLFTVHYEGGEGDEVGGVVPPTFSPMDAITIYLRRKKDFPVRVFTGFLDKIPYLQLFPGTVKVSASCTMKRLMHTYFDPALPYTMSFLAEYGWRNLGGEWVSLSGLQEWAAPGQVTPTSDKPNDKPAKNKPTGSQSKNIFVVGDSIGVGVKTKLLEQLGKNKGYKIESDTKGSRPTSTGLAILRKKGKNLPSTIVVLLGSNDDPSQLNVFRKKIDDVMKTAGKDRHVIWVNLHGKNIGDQSLTPLNPVLIDAAKEHPNLTVVKWSEYVDKNKIKMDKYGLHTSPAGYTKLASIIAPEIMGGATGGGDSDKKGNEFKNPDSVDGSLSQLLFATMKHIGGWDPNTIYIEAMPEDIFDRMTDLADSFAADNEEALKEAKALFRSIGGTGDLGSADGSADAGSGVDGGGNIGTFNGDVPEIVYKVGVAMNASPKLMLSSMMTGLVEAPISNGDSFGNPTGGDRDSVGWRQERAMYYDDSNNVNGSARRYFNEGKDIMSGKNPGKANTGRYQESWTPGNLSQAIQGSAYPDRYDAVRGKAEALLKKMKKRVENEEDTNNQTSSSDDDTSRSDTNGSPGSRRPRSFLETRGNVASSSTEGILNGIGTSFNNAEDYAVTFRARTGGGPQGDGSYTGGGSPRGSSSSGSSAPKRSRGSWKYNGDLPPLNKGMRDYMDAIASFFDGVLIVTSSDRPNAITASNKPSDHREGGAADLNSDTWPGSPLGGEGGTEIAIACHRAMGLSYNEAVREANRPSYDRFGGAQIIWKRDADHFDHVHVGLGKRPFRGTRGTGSGGGENTAPAPKPKVDFKRTLPSRSRSGKPKLIVLHSTESDNASGLGDLEQLWDILDAANLSVQVGTDAEGNSAEYVTDNLAALHASAFNAESLGIEQVGRASQTKWPEKQLKATAAWVAYWSDKYDIPLEQAEVKGSKVTKPGVIRHSQLGLAGSAGQGRSDPGENFPFDEVLELAGALVSGGGGGGAVDGPTNTGTVLSQAGAGAFFAAFDLPSVFTAAEAAMLGGEKSLLNDQPLLPFIQQLCSASLRHFQSLPDGRFYAFYPDYFGEFNQHPAYWEIDDIEILDGKVELTDENLITHMYVIGDAMSPTANNSIPYPLRSAFTSGVVTIFNAFMSRELLDRTPDKNAAAQARARKKDKKGDNDKEKGTGMDILIDPAEAARFLARYGARVVAEDMPMIKNKYFECFLAYQKFLLGWAQQFSTDFTFTFMPELFPGGKVAFPAHGLQMYIEQVNHSFDYESGFITTASLSAPSAYGKNTYLLPPNMVQAIMRPTAEELAAGKPTITGGTPEAPGTAQATTGNKVRPATKNKSTSQPTN